MVLMVTCIGILLAYMIPTLAVKSQKKQEPVCQYTQWVCCGIFLLFNYLSWLKWSGQMEYYLALFCLLLLLLIAITDAWFGLIPNYFTYPSILLLLIVRAFLFTSSPLDYYLAMIFGGLSLFVLASLTRGMGMGDVKLFGLSGLIIGWPDIWLALWLATISGTSYVVLRWLIQKPIGRKTPFPFGPHLALGIYLTYLYGDVLIQLFMYSEFYPF